MAERFRLVIDRSGKQHIVCFRGSEIKVSLTKPSTVLRSKFEFAIDYMGDVWSAFNFANGNFGIHKNGSSVAKGRHVLGEPRTIGETKILSTVRLQLRDVALVHEDIVRKNNSFHCPHQYGFRLDQQPYTRLSVMQYSKDHNVTGVIRSNLPFGIDHIELFAATLLLRSGALNEDC